MTLFAFVIASLASFKDSLAACRSSCSRSDPLPLPLCDLDFADAGLDAGLDAGADADAGVGLLLLLLGFLVLCEVDDALSAAAAADAGGLDLDVDDVSGSLALPELLVMLSPRVLLKLPVLPLDAGLDAGVESGADAELY